MTKGEEKIIENIKWKTPGHPGMNLKVNRGVPYIYYPQLEETGVVHGFSTRLGGVSEGIFSSMNLSFSRGDNPERVMENFRRMGDAIGFNPEAVVLSAQTHTTNVIRVGYKERGLGITRDKIYSDVDGMITNEKGIMLSCSFADCVPLYLVDPKAGAIGLSHSGWRGTVGKIGKITVEKMQEEFGCNPKDILAAIGPSICMDCYEVSEDVAQQFKEAYDNEVIGRMLLEKENGKYQLNLWEACRENFLEAGIMPEHIVMPQICTCCNPELLYSHRASHGKRGALASFLMLV